MHGHHASDVVYAHTEAPEALDPLSGEPTDRHGIPLSVAHSPQTNLPVWQLIHKLATPFPNPKSGDRPYTHICILCSASPPLRATTKRAVTWRDALMRQRMSTNAVAHMQRVHPEEFATIADYKQRKREALVEKAANAANESKKKRAKKTPGPKRKSTPNRQVDEKQESASTDAVPATAVVKTQRTGASAQKRAIGKTTDLVKTWLICRHLLKLSNLALPTATNLNAQVQDEFAKFGSFLGSYLASESQAAMSLPFLSLRHEFRPIVGATAEDGVRNDVVSNQEKAFLSVAVGFIDSQWRRVGLVLAAKEVPRGWSQQVNQLVTQTVSETYGIHSVSNYARFHVDSVDDSPSSLAAGLLTHTLRHCVINALGVGATSSFGGETNVRRILRLLQELLRFFEAPDRANALTEIGTTNGVHVTFYSLNPSWRRRGCSFPQTTGRLPRRSKPFEPPGAVPLEERIAPRPGAVAPSYALLFRRLLSVTVNASSLKCLSLEDDATVDSSPVKRTARRKAKRVDVFTQLAANLITQHFTSPASSSEVDDEIKAMLLDPRISSKAVNLVTELVCSVALKKLCVRSIVWFSSCLQLDRAILAQVPRKRLKRTTTTTKSVPIDG
ncbi:hypothetical protein GQ600_7961 [Phytophthora cactorum]|nr:hypothetical protein GQ600_7961 [Phytophthora cactorum]